MDKIPGLGYFYGGITRKKNLLTMLMSSGLAIAIVSFQVNMHYLHRNFGIPYFWYSVKVCGNEIHSKTKKF